MSSHPIIQSLNSNFLNPKFLNKNFLSNILTAQRQTFGIIRLKSVVLNKENEII